MADVPGSGGLGWRFPLAALVFAALTLLLGWTVGGQAELRRLDPAMAIATMPIAALAMALMLGKAPPRAFLAAGLLGAVLIVTSYAIWGGFLAVRIDMTQLVFTFVTAVLVTGVLLMLRHASRSFHFPRVAFVISAALCAALTVAFVPRFLASLYTPPASGQRPRVTMMTSLPLLWGGGSMADVIAGRTQTDPAFVALEAAMDITVTDTVPAGNSPLLIAHPYALGPRDLVRIDADVRDGRSALILADALSSWEPPFGIGDPRNPPITSLLTPLLDHWGIGLVAPLQGQQGVRRVADDAMRLDLYSAGRFERAPRNCTRFAGGAGLRCRIGRGQVTLLADADLLSAQMWQGGARTGHDRSRSDNIDWLVAELRRLSGLPPTQSAIFAPVRW